MSWVARLTTISLEMVLPGLIGYGLDQWLGTSYLLAIGGFVLGFIVAFLHLLRIAADDHPPGPHKSSRDDSSRPA
jgi:F0F1-type ATP synthase assembly protein I